MEFGSCDALKPYIYMTKVYFVRNAQPEYAWEDDRTRPLTKDGNLDSKIVLEFLKDKQIDIFYCSPYKRSKDTIAEAAKYFKKEIITDEELREREKGPDGNNHGMFEKCWENHYYHEECGESIRMVQERNIAALQEILSKNAGKNIVIGTHETALSTILNFYDSEFGCKDFLRIIDWMPYVIELDFEEYTLVSKREHCHVEKEFKGDARADKMQTTVIGRFVTVTVDRAMGTYHPDHKDIYYSVNYGYVEGIVAADGEEQDAYILGVDEPLKEFTGKIIAIVHRDDDVEEKWVVCPENISFSREEIMKKIHFQEQYFSSHIRM